MNPRLIEVRQRPSKNGAWLVMPLVDQLSIGVTPDADWIVDAAAGLRRAIRLVRVQGKVRLDPRGERSVASRGARLSDAVLVDVPFRFTVGTLEFEVCHARAADRDAAPRVAAAAREAGFAEMLRKAASPLAWLTAPTDAAASCEGPVSRRDLARGEARRRRTPFAPVAIVLVVGAAVAGAAAAVIAPAEQARPLAAAATATALATATAPGRPSLYAAPLVPPAAPLPAAMPARPQEPSAADPGAPSSASSLSPLSPGQEALRLRVEGLLQTGGFGSELRVTVADGRARVGGQAEPEEIDRLRRVLKRAARLDPRMGEVEVEAEAFDGEPPFAIQQIVAGDRPYVVLSDGTRLQPGGQHAGYRVVAIAAGRVTLQGSRRIEVVW